MRAFLSWWIDELAGSGRGRPLRWPPRRDFYLLRPAGRGHRDLEVSRVCQGSAEPIGRLRQDGRASPALLAGLRSRSIPLVLRLPAQLGIRVADRLPPQARRHLDEVVAHRLDIVTPLTAEQARYAYEAPHPPTADGLEVMIIAVPEEGVASAERALERLGLVPDCIDLADGDPLAPPRHDLRSRRLRVRRHWPRLRLAAVAALLLALISAAASSWVVMSGGEARARAMARLEHAKAMAEPAAGLEAVVARLRAASAALDEEIAAVPSTIATLAELTKALPDDVWLQELELANGSLSITGWAPDASLVVGRLEEDPAFADVQFSSAVTVEPAAPAAGPPGTAERFALVMRVLPPERAP
jgi:general secretion pathway protein L